jgi:hypothetical protein
MTDREYVLKRITTVLKRQTVCLPVELHRRLGEVGNPRLDPRLVDLVLEEQLASSGPKIASVQQEGLVLYSLATGPDEEVQSLIEQKVAVYRRGMRFKDSHSNIESVQRMLLLAAEEAARNEPSAQIRLDHPGRGEPSFLAFAGAYGPHGIPFKAFVSNELEWIYPQAAAVWTTLRDCCGAHRATPLLVGRVFHPSCFSFFKTIGMFGHQHYKLYFSPHVWPDFDRFTAFLGFPTGSTDAADAAHVRLFAQTLPKHIRAAFDTIDRLAALILEFSVERGLANPDLDPGLRLSRFASFLSRLPTSDLVSRLREDAAGAWTSL